RFVAQSDAAYAEQLVKGLLQAEDSQVPALVRNLDRYRKHVDPRLRVVLDDPDSSPTERLHASLALLPVDSGQADYLHARLLEVGFRDRERSGAKQVMAARILAGYTDDRPDELAELLRDANGDQLPVLLPALADADRERVAAAMEGELDRAALDETNPGLWDD